MIELERESDGFIKSFPFPVAERALRERKLKPKVKTWKLPDNSDYKFSDSGSLIKKAIKKPKKNYDIDS